MAWVKIPKENHPLFRECLPRDPRVSTVNMFGGVAAKANGQTITHGPRGDIVSLYTTFPWPELCAAVAKLRIELREGEIIEFPTVPAPATRYTAVTGAERARRRWRFPVTPSGIEPEIAP